MKPTTFAALVRWAAETYHEGVMYQLALRVGISPALADRWSKGLVRRPTLETVLKFCQAYGLEPTDVLKLTAPSLPAAAAAFLRKPVKRKAPPPHPIGGGSNHDGTPLASLAETMSRLSDAVKNWLRSLWYVPVPLTTTV